MEETSGALPPGATAPEARSLTDPSRALLLFTLPLATVNMLQLFSQHFILGGISRHPAPQFGVAEELAAFIVALSIMWLCASPIQGLGVIFLAFGDGPAVRPQLHRFAALLTVGCTAMLALLAFTPLGIYAVMHLQNLDLAIAERVQFALQPLVFWPVINVLLHKDNAILKRRGNSDTLAKANVLGVFFTVCLVVGGVYFRFDPLRVAPLAFLIGQGMRVAWLGVAVFSSRREEANSAKNIGSSESQRREVTPTWRVLAAFYLPVAFNVLLMMLSRPLIQWFLAAEATPEISIAAFGVAFSMAQLGYNWLNELATHPVAFRHQPEALRALPVFCAKLAAVVTVVMAGLFWTPLAGMFMSAVMGLSGEVLSQASGALAIMVFCPAVVALRGYCHGLATLHKHSTVWLTSAVARTGAHILVMILLPQFGLHGAVLGTAALLIGFVCETLTMVWCLAGSASRLPVPTLAK
jgi:hypothetical protein